MPAELRSCYQYISRSLRLLYRVCVEKQIWRSKKNTCPDRDEQLQKSAASITAMHALSTRQPERWMPCLFVSFVHILLRRASDRDQWKACVHVNPAGKEKTRSFDLMLPGAFEQDKNRTLFLFLKYKKGGRRVNGLKSLRRPLHVEALGRATILWTYASLSLSTKTFSPSLKQSKCIL